MMTLTSPLIGNVDDVAVVVGGLRYAVDLHELIGALVDVEGMQLVGRVADCPLLDGAELDVDVGSDSGRSSCRR